MSLAHLRSPTLALLLAATACSQPRAAEPSATCRVPVVAKLTTPPDAALLAELGRLSSADVTLSRPMAVGLYLLEVSAPGGEAACSTALERLRLDARVLSLERDSRRAPQAP